MGRRAKSFTNADRQAGARQRRCTYLLTPRAIELQHSARRARYWRLHGRQGSTPHSTEVHSRSSIYVDELPTALIRRAEQQLPESSHFFQLAKASRENLDESDLHIWDRGPPYKMLGDSSSDNKKRFTARLIEVMHGQWARGLDEITENKPGTMDHPEIRLYWKELYHIARCEWEQQDEVLAQQEERGGHRELEIAKIWFQWVAHRALHFHSLSQC